MPRRNYQEMEKVSFDFAGVLKQYLLYRSKEKGDSCLPKFMHVS